VVVMVEGKLITGIKSKIIMIISDISKCTTNRSHLTNSKIKILIDYKIQSWFIINLVVITTYY
jgi:hypothetical protein